MIEIGCRAVILSFDWFYCLCSADPFAKKDWYDIKAPSLFNVKQVGKTLVSRTQGTKVLLLVFFSC